MKNRATSSTFREPMEGIFLLKAYGAPSVVVVVVVVFHSYGSCTSVCLRSDLTERKHRGATDIYLGSKHSCARWQTRGEEEEIWHRDYGCVGSSAGADSRGQPRTLVAHLIPTKKLYYDGVKR